MNRFAPLCPGLVVARANALASVGGPLPPDYIKRLRSRWGRTDGPWHTAFVHHVGFTAHLDEDTGYSTWPLPERATVEELVPFAEGAGILEREPHLGDIALLWSAAGTQFVRTGIVVAIHASLGPNGIRRFDCTTVEGDTTRHGAPSGTGIHRLERRVEPGSGHRFVRWVDLDGYRPPRRRAALIAECIAPLAYVQ